MIRTGNIPIEKSQRTLYIALVTETFPPEINGVAMTLEKLATGIQAKGHKVTVIRPNQGKIEEKKAKFEEFLVPGIPLPKYKGLRMGWPALIRLSLELKKDPPDIVYLATEGPLGLSVLWICNLLEIPTVSGFHTNFQQYMQHYKMPFLTKAAECYMRWMHNATRRTFGPSEDLLSDLQKMGFRNLRLLGRGVDAKLFSPERRDPELRRHWGADEKSAVYIYVGRIAREKNTELLLRAWNRIQTQSDDAKLVIVGDGPQLREIQSINDPSIRCTGAQRGEELARHYASGDVFLFPSRTETFGNVVTEAMASGLLVLAFDYAAPKRYIVRGINGFSVPFGDEDRFVEQCELVDSDREQWPALREQARRTALTVSWERILDSFINDLVEVVDESNPQPRKNSTVPDCGF